MNEKFYPAAVRFLSVFSLFQCAFFSRSPSEQDTLEATDVALFVHNKPFQLFPFLFVSAAALTSNPLRAERTKPTACAQPASIHARWFQSPVLCVLRDLLQHAPVTRNIWAFIT